MSEFLAPKRRRIGSVIATGCALLLPLAAVGVL
jgi:hypothetical protein